MVTRVATDGSFNKPNRMGRVSVGMVEQQWPEIGGKELRYGDHTWELTGDVDVRGTGEVIEAKAKELDDVRHRNGTLRFNLEQQPASLNPGNLGDHFDELQREGDRYRIIVKKEPRTYHYNLESFEFE